MIFLSCKKNNDTNTGSSNITVDSVFIQRVYVRAGATLHNVPLGTATVKISFLNAVNPAVFSKDAISFSGIDYDYQFSPDGKSMTLVTKSQLSGLTSYTLNIQEGICEAGGKVVAGYKAYMVTVLDTVSKFPAISDSALLTKVQQQTFKYFWDYGHATSGLARDRLGSADIVTTGGSGFGMMAILVGIERGFISRQEGFAKLLKMVTFLNRPNTDKFHGAFPHWMNGNTGKVFPFSTNDNGADLVETAFLMEGLLTVREYFKAGTSADEQSLNNQITTLWQNVEWDWFTQGGQNVLYWHWSPDKGWIINMQIRGWDEALIVYILAASSPTHSISKQVYDNGWANNGAIRNGKVFYGYTLPLGEDKGGPLFFAHYSFLGLNPKNLQDVYANYWTQNVSHSKINYSYCVANPKGYIGYGTNCWGLTASDIENGYAASSPNSDVGVIAPTAALSSFPYTPIESMQALHYFYYMLGDKLWGAFGFYDAFNMSTGWFANSYLAIDEGPIIDMIENYRTGLLWNTFMSTPDVKNGLNKLGFTY